MNAFGELLTRFNERIFESDSELKHFQTLRAEHHGQKVSNYNFWGSNSKFERDLYAYHHGGQKELQFNISEEDEDEDGNPVFRYGVAFSVEASRSNPDPETTLEPYINRFNQFLKLYPGFFKGYKMWTWFVGKRSATTRVKPISDDLMMRSTFIFIGKILPKYSEDMTDEDIDFMIDEFEVLLPVYKYVQLEDDAAISENKVSRVCWNENDWLKPSGWKGKSKFEKSYERQYGYGHEEWLFDFSKLVGGYHYGFLESIHKFREKYEGSMFNISLYTVNGDTKEKFWLGEISNVYIPYKEESLEVVEVYRKKGWLDEMVNNLSDVGADSKSLKKWFDESLFNLRFRKEDYKPLPQPVLVDDNDRAIPSPRYILLNKVAEPKAVDEANGEFVLGKRAKGRGSAKSVRKTFESRSIEIPQIHNRVSEGLERWLKTKYESVFPEHDTGFGTSIDMVAEHKGEIYFYEIKTYGHVKACVREALGQLVEYAYYPDKKLADKLFIVSQHKADAASKKYIEHVRKALNLPLHYIGFDYEKNEIIDEF